MFFELYVLIEQNISNFVIEGIYTKDQIYSRQQKLQNKFIFNKYFIRGPYFIKENTCMDMEID